MRPPARAREPALNSVGSLVLTLVCAVPLALAPGLAAAQPVEVGVLQAIAGEQPVPTGEPIAVVAETFDDGATKIRAEIEAALTDSGYTVRFNAPLLLTFSLQHAHQVGPLPTGAIHSGMQAELAESEDEQPSVDFGQQGPVGDAPQMPDNVLIEYDFGGSGEIARSPRRYNLDLVLGASGAPPLWQGSMTAALPTADPVKAVDAMLPPLIAHLGRTVPERRVVLDQP